MKLMKKTVAIVLAVAMLVLAVPFSTGAESVPTIKVNSVSAYPGDKVDVKIDISNNPGIISMLIKVEYDAENLTLTKITNGTTLPGPQHNVNQLSKNPVTINFADDTASENIISNGTIVTFSFDVKENAEIGKADVKVTYEEDNAGIYNFDLKPVHFDVENGGVTVLGKDLPKITAKDNSSVYDGKVKNITLSGVPEYASVKYTVDSKEFNGTKNVGTYNVTASVTAPGYNEKTVSAKLSITPKNLTVGGFETSSKQYDGTTYAPISSGAYLIGVVDGDNVSATFPERGTFASANVGKNIAVTYEQIKLGSSDASNYTLTQPTLKADITPVNLNVVARSYNIKLGEKIPELLYDITNEDDVVEGEEAVALTGALATKADGKKTGSFDITNV